MKCFLWDLLFPLLQEADEKDWTWIYDVVSVEKYLCTTLTFTVSVDNRISSIS